jgi:ABC-type glycerol-3-phosphate transport system substrate-binding protein
MSPKKIIFFVIAGIILIALMIGAWKLSNTNKEETASLESLEIWVLSDETEWYAGIVEGFKKAYPEYKNTAINFKKFGAYSDYKQALLSVLADNAGPDIFMVQAGKDSLLESKIEPIPDGAINIDDILKRFDPVFFAWLIEEVKNEEEKSTTSYIRWIPLGYETLGIFYNKWLFPNAPTTWAELDKYTIENQRKETLPVALGMSSRYIQNGNDIISLFFLYGWVDSYLWFSDGSNLLERYLGYRNINQDWVNPEESVSEDNLTIGAIEDAMSEENTTTTDLFIEEKIGMIFGYPSLIRELEKAKKRAGSSAGNSLILTAPMLKNSLDKPIETIAQYTYFGISKATKHPNDALAFLNYLTTEEAQAKYLESFPYYIGAQTSFHENQKNTALSKEFWRTRLWSFMDIEQKATVFNYWIWSDFEDGMVKIIDRMDNIDINKELWALGKKIQCRLDQVIFQKNLGTNCSETNW